MSAVETFEILFKSENSYLSSSIWKNEMAAGPALYMSAAMALGACESVAGQRLAVHTSQQHKC